MLARTSEEISGLPKPTKLPLARGRSEAFEWALFYVVVVALAWVPFWYGSNEPLAWGINAVLFPGLAVIYEVFILTSGKGHPVGLRQIWTPAALFVSVILWIFVQNATWTPAFLHHPIWAMAADALGRPVEESISVNRDLSTSALVRLMTAASVFWITMQLCRNTLRVTFFVAAIATIIAGYSAYGIVSFSMKPDTIHWMGNTLSLGFVTSTFVNRDHFATYSGIGLVVCCGLILRFYKHTVTIRGGSLQFKIASVIEATGQQGAILLGGAFLILVAFLLTGSRGGLVATGSGLVALGVLFLRGRSVGFNGRRAVLLFGTFLITAVLLTFGDMIFGQITEKGIADDNRVAAYIIVLRSILDAPMLGFGYGSFIDTFPMFRDRSVVGQEIWEFAHNTYLETFQGLGLVFGFALVASVALLVLRCANGAISRLEGMMAPRVAASVAFLVGVNALVDFSLQIQAVALTFAAILGAGVAQSESSRLALND